jgi:branched-chain amino acid transport system permease protein
MSQLVLNAPIAGPRVARSTQASRIFLAVGPVLLVAAAALPFWGDRHDMQVAGEFATYVAMAELWNMLAGYAGLVSVGQQAFVGLGGYALFVFATLAGMSPLAALPLAGVVAAVFAIPTALVVFRLRGAYFAIGTWVIAEVYRLGFAQISALGGGSGTSLPIAVVRSLGSVAQRSMLIYWAALVIGVLVVGLVYALLRSRAGLALAAIRDSEPAAESLGVDARRTKLMVYVVVAFATGIVGALIFLQKLRISPDAAFSVTDWTAFVIFMVVIGGVGTVEGPILGTIVFFLLRQFLADLGSWYLIILGGTAVLVMLLAPQGLWGIITRRLNLHLLPVRRRLILE